MEAQRLRPFIVKALEDKSILELEMEETLELLVFIPPIPPLFDFAFHQNLDNGLTR
jgi:hypothetical protein